MKKETLIIIDEVMYNYSRALRRFFNSNQERELRETLELYLEEGEYLRSFDPYVNLAFEMISCDCVVRDYIDEGKLPTSFFEGNYILEKDKVKFYS